MSLAESMGYVAYEIQDNMLHSVDCNRFPCGIVEDILFIRKPLRAIEYTIVAGRTESMDETLARVSHWLEELVSYNKMDTISWLEEYRYGICHTLKDYPEYCSHPRNVHRLRNYTSKISCHKASRSLNEFLKSLCSLDLFSTKNANG